MPRQLINLTLDEVSSVDEPANPHARVVLMKRMEEHHMAPSIGDALTKALSPDPTDTEREAADKALVRKQLETGALKAEQYGAELALESHAASIRKADPSVTPEQAYVRAMEQNPALAKMLVD